MNAAANTDPNAPADSPTSKRTRRKPDPEPERRTPPARRPKAGQPDPEEGRIQRRNPPDPAIDLPFSDVINKLIGASGRTRKDVAQAAGISEDAIRSSTTLSAVSKQSAIAFVSALEDADRRR